MESIKLIGGMSLPGCVSIFSKKYVATAKSLKAGIRVTVRDLSLPNKIFNIWFIPKVVKLVIFMLSAAGLKVKLFFLSYLIVLITSNQWIQRLDNKIIERGYLWRIIFLELGILALVCLFIKTKIAKWHGAEHMAISAYKRCGLADIIEMAQENHINPECGGRLFLPFILIYATSFLTIPKKIALQGDLVVIPRKEYEALLWLKKIREFIPTVAQRNALIRARKNRKEGKYLTIDELRRKLDFTS